MSDSSKQEIAMLQLEEWLNDSSASNNASLRFIAAVLYVMDNNIKSAIKLMQASTNLEQ